jgi:hypothetical protein
MLICASQATAATGYFSISQVRKGNYFRFPILNCRLDCRAETKINQLLQLSELRGLAGSRNATIFDDVILNDGSIYGGKVALSYSIRSNNPRILSVQVNDSLDGATTHWWTTYYNFNSQNGDRVALRDLFTDSGYEKFVQFAATRRSRAYRSQVIRKVAADEQEAFLSVINYFKNDDLDDFEIGGRSITIDGSDLLGKSLCCEDLNMKIRFEVGEFRSWLNDFGKTVFGIRFGSVRNFRSAQLPQLLFGTANGKSRFVAILKPTGTGSAEGIYAYLKYRTGIYLTGSVTNGQIDLTEHLLVKTPLSYQTNRNSKWVDGGTISATLVENGIRGRWTDKDGKQNASIEGSFDQGQNVDLSVLSKSGK